MNTIDCYPVVIYEDRYGGVYSGGEWIAVCSGCREGRNLLEMDGGPYDGDFEAGEWGADIPEWAAVGNTPNEALHNLYTKHSKEAA